MKKYIIFVVILELLTLSASAGPRRTYDWHSWIGNFGGGSIGPVTACIPTSCETQHKNCGQIQDGCGHTLDCGSCSGIDTCGGGGTPDVCGQVCYEYGFISDQGGVDNVYHGKTCEETPANLTHLTSTGHTFSHLSIGPVLPNISFFETDTDAGGHVTNYMSLASLEGSWSVMDGAHEFTARHVSWDRGEAMAFISQEADGYYTIRINRNSSHGYPASDSVVVYDRLGSRVPREIAWIPMADFTESHRLVLSISEPPSAAARLFVLDLNANRLMPLEAPSTPATALQGEQPSLSHRGSRVLFVKNADHRIYSCEFDFSQVDAGHAFCGDMAELPSTRRMGGDFASPCWSYDNQWVFYAYRDDGSSWDIYRDRYNTSEPFGRQGIVLTDANEKDVVCAPVVYYAVTNAAVVAPLREPSQTVYAVPSVQTYAPLRSCTNDSECPTGQTCQSGSCRAAPSGSH